MVDDASKTGTGDGTKKMPSRTEFYATLIPIFAASLILPALQMYFAHTTELARLKVEIQAKEDREVAAQKLEEIESAQTVTHAAIKQVAVQAAKASEKAETAAVKAEEIHETVNKIAGALPPRPDKPSADKPE
jgi:hypothetical protein